MKLTYTITAEDYQEAIAFQIRLKQKTLFSRLRYWLGSWGLFLVSVYFGAARPEYPLTVRMIPAVIAALMLAIASGIRFSVERRAAGLLRKYVQSGALNEGFLGTHMLSVRRDTILLEYGRHSQKIFCRQVEDLHRCERTSFLMAGGVIFDLIPNAVLDKDGCREELIETIRNNILEMQREQSDVRRAAIEAEFPHTFCSCVANRERTARGLAAGYRMYYSTTAGWKGHQSICALILIYGLVTFFAGPDKTIGLLFIVIGFMLNRRLLTALSPLALSTARQTLMKQGSALADDFFYTTDREIVSISYGQEVRCDKRDVLEKRENREFLVFYTKNQRMVVIHKAAFTSPEQLTRFKNLL